MKIRSFMFGATGMLLAATQAQAQSDPVVIEGGMPSVTVSYADLNITSAPGRRALEGRVTRAASDLCLDGRPTALDEFMAGKQCFGLAMSKALVDIDLAVARARSQFASAGTIGVAAR